MNAEPELKPGRVEAQHDGALLRIVLSNPARRNAMSLAMWTTLADVLGRVVADDTRVILLRGAGDASFVSGADLSEFADRRNDAAAIAAYDAAVQRALVALIESPVPVIACMRGLCIGGGMGLALSCDLRYASRTTRFRMPAARLGIGYPLPGVERMVGTIGAARAAELFYTARMFDGVEAERIGFVHRAYDEAELEPAVEAALAQIAANAPLSIRAAKLAIRAALTNGGAKDVAAVERAVEACATSADYIEGRRAFMEKRAPRFAGR